MNRQFKSLLLCLAGFYLLMFNVVNAQEPIPLYNGAAPDSEEWDWEEKIIQTPDGNFIPDISEPVLLPFPASDPCGTVVVVAPGAPYIQ